MFDTVGHDLDPDHTRRSLTATLVAALLCGGLGAWGSWWTVTTFVEPVLVEEAETLLDFLPEEDPDLPDLPPPPPVPPPEAEERRTTNLEPAAAPELPELPVAPAPITPSPVVDAAQPARATPAPRGTGGPVAGVAATGRGRTVGHAVHFSELGIKRRVAPTFPPLESDEAMCTATVIISPQGRAQRVAVVGCPPAYAKATRIAVQQWRWQKPRIDGRPTAVQTTYSIAFKAER